MAYLASVQILTQFRKAIGNKKFGSFLSLKKRLNSLVIAIDTECAIGDYVELAKRISMHIVDQYREIEFAPHNYILISFNTDSAQIKANSEDPRDLTEAIQKLNSCSSNNSPNGNMYYHSLVEALKKCQSSSVIYTFTDSPARDAYIKHQARALLRDKGVVIYSFMGQQMKTRQFKAQADLYDPLDGSDGDTDLATITGGLTYPITNDDQRVISEFVLRRLAWTRLQSLVLLKSNASSITFYVDSSIDELYLDISSMGKLKSLKAHLLCRYLIY